MLTGLRPLRTAPGIRLAIVGGGAAAREFFIRLIELGAHAVPVFISVFEPRPVLGRGIAWTRERAPVIANMRLETLGPSYHQYDLLQRILRDLEHPEANAEYPTRNAVGDALDERWRRTAVLLPSRWKLDHIRAKAANVMRQGSTATVLCEDGSDHRGFDIVILALGNLSEKRPPDLPANIRLVDGWDVAAIESIPPDCDVLIKGAGLTAIDATLRLLHGGHVTGRGSIVWQSRSGTLPFVRPQQLKLDPGFLSCDAICPFLNRLATQQTPLRVSTLWHLFALEMRSQKVKQRGRFAPGTDFDAFLALVEKSRDPHKGRQFLDEGIAGADSVSLWFSVAKLFDEYTIPMLWNALPDGEKALFLADWRREYDRYFEPMPADNARRLRQWIADGSIQMLRGELGVQADPDSGKVLFDTRLEDALGETPSAQLQQRYCRGLDFLIDAGGISSDLDKLDSPLVANLVRSGLLTSRKLRGASDLPGLGARIDWSTGAIIAADERPSDWLYALAGSISVSAHWYTNSFMAASVSAQRTAADIARRLFDHPG
jgi:hypothetical protein